MHARRYVCTYLRVSSLRRGHANILCIVSILWDDPRRESGDACMYVGLHIYTCTYTCTCTCITAHIYIYIYIHDAYMVSAQQIHLAEGNPKSSRLLTSIALGSAAHGCKYDIQYGLKSCSQTCNECIS